MMPLNLIVNDDGSTNFVGVDTGRISICAINEKEKLIALKIAGHRCWISVFEPNKYFPAKFVIHRFNSIEYFDGGYKVELPELFGALEWDVRKSK